MQSFRNRKKRKPNQNQVDEHKGNLTHAESKKQHKESRPKLKETTERKLHYSMSFLQPFILESVGPKYLVKLDTGPLPSSAWAGWRAFDSETEVEAAKCVLYFRPMLRMLSSSHLRCMPGVEEEEHDVMSDRRRSPNFQKADHVKPLDSPPLSGWSCQLTS
jgi:hypothetical protein